MSNRMTDASLSSVEKSLLVAAYYRGGNPDDNAWGSNCDQVVTLSLFYTGQILFEDCAERFSRRSYVSKLYGADGKLDEDIAARYRMLINLIGHYPKLIQGGGDLKRPADPTYTACRLTHAGQHLACSLVTAFPQKPEFANWPDRTADLDVP